MLNYNLLTPSNVTCVYVFRAGHLALDNQLMSSSLAEDHLSCSQLFSVAYGSMVVLAFSLFTLACLLMSSLFSIILILQILGLFMDPQTHIANCSPYIYPRQSLTHMSLPSQILYLRLIFLFPKLHTNKTDTSF